MRHFKSLSTYFEYMQLPAPEHPMLSVLISKGEGYLPCPRESSPPIATDFYTISLKKIVHGNINYGRTKYDFENGSMLFMAPRQVLQWDKSLVADQRGATITFHEDFIKGTPLVPKIKKYGFFAYSINEALHLSPKEEEQMQNILEQIDIEYQNNTDAFSKDIIISQLNTLLTYANRFYERQFIHRKSLSNNLLDRFNQQLIHYFEADDFALQGMPKLSDIAQNLSVSQRYLSDMLKKETGKSASEHIQWFLIDQAKDKLLDPQKSISEVAYELGFEYPQYFARVFKKRVGMSPTKYRDTQMLN